LTDTFWVFVELIFSLRFGVFAVVIVREIDPTGRSRCARLQRHGTNRHTVLLLIQSQHILSAQIWFLRPIGDIPANIAAVMVLFSRGGAHLDNMATNAGNATPYSKTFISP